MKLKEPKTSLNLCLFCPRLIVIVKFKFEMIIFKNDIHIRIRIL